MVNLNLTNERLLHLTAIFSLPFFLNNADIISLADDTGISDSLTLSIKTEQLFSVEGTVNLILHADLQELKTCFSKMKQNPASRDK